MNHLFKMFLLEIILSGSLKKEYFLITNLGNRIDIVFHNGTKQNDAVNIPLL